MRESVKRFLITSVLLFLPLVSNAAVFELGYIAGTGNGVDIMEKVYLQETSDFVKSSKSENFNDNDLVFTPDNFGNYEQLNLSRHALPDSGCLGDNTDVNSMPCKKHEVGWIYTF